MHTLSQQEKRGSIESSPSRENSIIFQNDPGSVVFLEDIYVMINHCFNRIPSTRTVLGIFKSMCALQCLLNFTISYLKFPIFIHMYFCYLRIFMFTYPSSMQPAGKHAYSLWWRACISSISRVEDINEEGSASVTSMILYLNNSQINTMVGFRYQMSNHIVMQIQLLAFLSLVARMKQMVKKICSWGKAWK